MGPVPISESTEEGDHMTGPTTVTTTTGTTTTGTDAATADDVTVLTDAEFTDYLDPETSPVAIIAEPERHTTARLVVTIALAVLAVLGVAVLAVAVFTFLVSTPSLDALWRSLSLS